MSCCFSALNPLLSRASQLSCFHYSSPKPEVMLGPLLFPTTSPSPLLARDFNSTPKQISKPGTSLRYQRATVFLLGYC